MNSNWESDINIARMQSRSQECEDRRGAGEYLDQCTDKYN